MDSVAGRPQLVGKRQEPRRLPLRVMKQEYRCHHGTVASLRPAFNAAPGSPGKPRDAQQESHALDHTSLLHPKGLAVKI